MNKTYSFSILSSFVGLWISNHLPKSVELILGFLLIFTFGMIHGSNDIMVVRELNSNLKINKILFTYLLVVSIAVLIFYLFPILAVFLFIIFSAYHFGEQHWDNKTLDCCNPLKSLFFFSYGLLILFLIFIFNEEEVKKIIFDITGYKILELYSFFVIITTLIILTTLSAYYVIKNKINLGEIIKDCFTMLVLTIIFKSSSLIWGFCIYFIIWHSIPSLLDQITFVYGDYKKKSIIKYTSEAFPYWIISLAGIVGLYLIFSNDKQFYSLFFSFIAAVTFPHAIVMLSMFKKKYSK